MGAIIFEAKLINGSSIMVTQSYAARTVKESLKPFSFQRREVGENDVKIDIEYCGVCYSDLHMVNNDWGISDYPLVPGHEIIGHVVEVGSNVDKFIKGDLVGVGCMVDSCRKCSACEENLEQFCDEGMVMTYGSQILQQKVVLHKAVILLILSLIKILF